MRLAHDPHRRQFGRHRGAAAGNDNEVGQQRPDLADDHHDQHRTEQRGLSQRGGPHLRLHHDRHADEQRDGGDKFGGLVTGEQNLPRQHIAHRATPMAG